MTNYAELIETLRNLEIQKIEILSQIIMKDIEYIDKMFKNYDDMWESLYY